MSRTTTMSRPRFLGLIADACAMLRSDWTRADVMAALDEADRDRHAPLTIACAAFDTAASTNADPRGITDRLRDGWGATSRGWTKQAIDAAKAPLPHGQPYARCSGCGLQLVGGETREDHQTRCQRDLESPTRLAAIAAAREVASGSHSGSHSAPSNPVAKPDMRAVDA